MKSSQKLITQAVFETIILPKLAHAKEQSALQRKQLHFAEWVSSLGYKPEFNEITFFILNLTVISISPLKTGAIFNGTDLLTNINYEGCEFNKCDFSECNLSESTFGKEQVFYKCKLFHTILQNCLAVFLRFSECEMTDICFDSSRLENIIFINSNLRNAIFSFLIYAENLLFQDCNLNGVSFLSAKIRANCIITYREPTIINNLQMFGKNIKLINAQIKAADKKIGLIWCHQEPGYLASCARQSIFAKGLQPILIEYAIPFKEDDLFKLEHEVKSASALVKKVSDQKKPLFVDKSFTMLLFDVIHENKQQFPLMVKLVNYTREAIKDMDGMFIPGGADINPLMYGEEQHPETKPIWYKEEKNKIYYDFRRDIIDFSTVYLQDKTRLPTYGICRGSQIIALYYGATFYQHIGYERRKLGDILTLEKSEEPRAHVSNMTAFTPKLLDSKQDMVVGPRVGFLHHQAYDFQLTAEASLFDILATTTVNDKRITLAAESLARNIFLVQFHPEMGLDMVLAEQLSIDANMASSFLDGFITCIDGYTEERNKKRVYNSVSLQHLHLITSPRYHPKQIIANLSFHSVIIGKNAVALASGISAISRGERIAFVMDSVKSHQITAQKDFISESVFTFIKSLLLSIEAQSLLKDYLKNKLITKELSPVTGYLISVKTLENLLLTELRMRQVDATNNFIVIEVKEIDTDLFDRIDMHRQGKITQQYLRDMTAVRINQNVDTQTGVLSIAHVQKIDQKMIHNDKAIVKLNFTNLQIFNGKEQKIEKGMLEISGDHVVSNFPVVPYHVSVLFTMKNDKIDIAHPVTPVPLKKIQEAFSWEHTSRPYSKISVTDSESLFYLNAELPRGLYLDLIKADNQQAIIAAKKAIYDYAVALLQDSFSVQTIQSNIEIQFSQHLEISVFQLDFSQLDRTFIPIVTAAKFGAITFFGNGKASSLSTCRSSLDLSMEMMILYNSLQNYKSVMSAESLSQMLKEYHAGARTILDSNRVNIQEAWINSRNARQVVSLQYAMLNNYIQLLARDVVEFLNLKIIDTETIKELDKILAELNKLYLPKDKLVAYEDLIQELGFNDKLLYFKKVKQVCDQLEKVMEVKLSLIPEVNNTLVSNYLMDNAERLVLINHICESQLSNITEDIELLAVNQLLLNLTHELALMLDHKDMKDLVKKSDEKELLGLLAEYKKISIPLYQVNQYESFVSQLNYKSKFHYYEHLKELNAKLVGNQSILQNLGLMKIVESINEKILPSHSAVADRLSRPKLY